MKERIAYLFMQYYHNKSTREEMEEFFQVISQAKYDGEINRLVKKVYEEIKLKNPSLTYIDREGNLVLRDPDWMHQPNPETAEKRKGNQGRYIYSVVASLIFAAGVIFISHRVPATRSNPAVVQRFTERAELKYLLLSDSTQVWLNASSTIDYPEQFDPEKREVYLKGEAFFDVKHADKVPFIIHTGKVTTVVLGTAFNIKAYGGEQHIRVSVKRGKVRVLKGGNVVSVLVKGQEVKIPLKGKQGRTEIVSEKGQVGAWQHGYLSYEDESFRDIINDMARVYNTDINLESQDLEGLQITTSFNRDIGLKKALQILCKLTDSKLNIINDQYYINKIEPMYESRKLK